MVGMRRVRQRVHFFLVAGQSSGIFERAAPGAVDQAGLRTVCFCGPAGNELEPVKPAVSEVVFVERFA